MAQPPRPPLFLARPGYRQRRLRDAIRVVPVAGAILLMIPLLWPRGPAGPGNATVLIYVFGVWTLLIAVSLLLTRRLQTDDDDPHPEATVRGAPEVPIRRKPERPDAHL